MTQLLILILVGAALPVTTSPQRASTRPSSSSFAAQVEAFNLLQQNETKKAAPILEKIYLDTPLDQRSRALVMNHAIVDLAQHQTVMRGVKDLTTYLRKHRDPDEPATNLLAVALNTAVGFDWKLKRGELWQAGFREWDRRNEDLDRMTPGWRRWGTRWITDAELAQIRSEMKANHQAVIEQQTRCDKAHENAQAIHEKYTVALSQRESDRQIVQYLQSYNNTYGPNAALGQPPAAGYDPYFIASQTNTFMADAMRVTEDARRLSPELAIAVKEFSDELQKLQELQAKVVRPKWPTSFDPVDPTSPAATKPPAIAIPTTAPTTQRATTAPSNQIRGLKPLPGEHHF